ncbi:N-acetyltransferase [Gordonia sp. ABSL11-1]|uniref:GNAT family N-acetyltransferase n=1 Tax=Gordonia sp. ABSL11-1 TaxID=3053924 RepID=UPI0025740555|nr:N-acetyltransferase [Gordonia sp. ABSL11-1]MDL9944291.1 N-acetyltransferase [Gordonia sp. ABSL11-1]
MSAFEIRHLGPDEKDLLVTATLGNLNWREGRFSRFDVLDNPTFAHYTRLVPDRGDFGLVAERDSRPVGVGWALFTSADEPGYGYVDSHTPEFSVWVADDARGLGIGRALTIRVLAVATRRAIPVSLSVEEGNTRASKLYKSLGFTSVPGCADDGVMIWHPRDHTRNNKKGPA